MGANGDVISYNLFAYCSNDPLHYTDPSGHGFFYLDGRLCYGIEGEYGAFLDGSGESFYYDHGEYIVLSSSHDANRRPNTGEPGSTYRAPNGDERTYGPDRRPQHDYDHDDHGFPDKHPHDANGGHNHDWINGVRGPAYNIGWEQVVGIALVTICVIGVVIVAVDDVSGIGVADDFLFGPLGTGIGSGFALIF